MNLEISEENITKWAQLGSRATYGLTLLNLAKSNSSFLVASADLGNSSGLDRFKNSFPDRFINLGIAEQNMIGVASGMSFSGQTIFVSSFAPFISLRAAEQMRIDLGYMQANVKAIGIGSGLAMTFLGNTHFGLEDIGVIRSIPGIKIVSPADCLEIVKTIEIMLVTPGPFYIRLTGIPNYGKVYNQDYKFELGKSVTLRSGSDIGIIATGSSVSESIKAANILEHNSISATVINMHTIKPIDYEAVVKLARTVKLIVTVEEHSIIGGTGSAVSEILSELKTKPPLLRIGLPDAFVETGEYEYMLKLYGIDAEGISKKILKFFDR